MTQEDAIVAVPRRQRRSTSPAHTYVAFLRAVNVAGHARVRMTAVRDAFDAAGCQKARTFIQSGNVIFESPRREVRGRLQQLGRTLRDLLGEEPIILVRTLGDIERLISRAPFTGLEGRRDVKLYVAFLSHRPRRRPTLPLISTKERLEAVALHHREAFIVSRPKPNGFFGIPNHFVEQELGVRATSRNWSTVTKLMTLLGAEPDVRPRHGSRQRAHV